MCECQAQWYFVSQRAMCSSSMLDCPFWYINLRCSLYLDLENIETCCILVIEGVAVLPEKHDARPTCAQCKLAAACQGAIITDIDECCTVWSIVGEGSAHGDNDIMSSLLFQNAADFAPQMPRFILSRQTGTRRCIAGFCAYVFSSVWLPESSVLRDAPGLCCLKPSIRVCWTLQQTQLAI